MRKVLLFVEFYEPGYKSGGPLQTIKNIVDVLGREVEFYIVTRDRDLGDKAPYSDVEIGTWQKVGMAKVFYLPQSMVNFGAIRELMLERSYDFVYLNSFFSFRFSILPMLVHRFVRLENKLLVAPRGEFSPGALGIKSIKKHLFVRLARLLGLYKNSIFHASTELEKSDIERVLGKGVVTRVAKDLPNVVMPSLPNSFGSLPDSTPLEVCFISRLVPKKNLDVAIRILSACQSNIGFTIYGSKEDPSYWKRCESLLRALPRNVSWVYGGELYPDQVKETFARFDVFLFPTRGENYGHVIAEALLSGTFVLISDQTPWERVDEVGVGRSIPLGNQGVFVSEIDSWGKLTPAERGKKKWEIQKNSVPLVIDERDVADNRALFTS